MLARQSAFERSRQIAPIAQAPVRAGCVFAKFCNLSDAIIDYTNPSGMVPTDSLEDYGEIAWLGAREVDESGLLNLQTISGSTLSLGLGQLVLRAPALAAPVIGAGVALGTAAAATLTGLVALFWTPKPGRQRPLHRRPTSRPQTCPHAYAPANRTKG
jgi:hypothetical protein